MVMYPEMQEISVSRAEIEWLRAACRCALAALTQNATYSADVALAVLVLREAVSEESESAHPQPLGYLRHFMP